MTFAMSVSGKGIGFMLDRMGNDCGPLQFIRELTQNSIEAITRHNLTGEVVWDIDQTAYKADETIKLSIIDNGIGMDKHELEVFINQLSSSGGVQSMKSNYGLGAKIAAATRNHCGVVYRSWKDGKGHAAWLWKDPASGMYGLRDIGDGAGVIEINDTDKNPAIKNRGTMVTLMGNFAAQNTADAPTGASCSSKWISFYLNMRYFKFPHSVKVKVREGINHIETKDGKHWKLREAIGMERYLNSVKQHQGSVAVNGATVHWWILKKDRPNISEINPAGHVAALYQDELYEMRLGKSGNALLNRFGIIFEMKHVVIYVQPTYRDGITTDTARTQLKLNGGALPWEEWADEFRDKLPKELSDLQQDCAAGSTDKSRRSVQIERLNKYIELYNLNNYQPCARGKSRVSTPTLPGFPSSNDAKPANGGYSGRGDSASNFLSTLLNPNGQAATAIKMPMQLPDVVWDTPTSDEQLVGWAGVYMPGTRTLKLNKDFCGFSNLVDHFIREYKIKSDQSPAITVIKEAVKSWYEFTMLDAYMGLIGLKKFNPDLQLSDCLTPAAITTLIMQRYHQTHAIKREIGSQLGSAT